MGRQFIKIGIKNYNIAMIESWYVTESNDDKQPPQKPETSHLRMGY